MTRSWLDRQIAAGSASAETAALDLRARQLTSLRSLWGAETRPSDWHLASGELSVIRLIAPSRMHGDRCRRQLGGLIPR